MTNFRMLGFLLVLGVAAAGWVLTCAAWQLERVAAGVAPLEPVSFDRLTLVLVGTGGAYENPDRLGPCTAVARGDRIALVDAGRGVAEALRKAEIPVSQPETVWLTSLLPEDTVGLDDLLASGWLDGRTRPIALRGPPGTRALAESIEAALAAGVAAQSQALGLDPAGARFEVEEIGDGWSGESGGVGVRAGALPGGPIEAFAYRFEADGRSAVVAGAGWAPEALAAFARSADALVHEAVFVPTPEIAAEAGITVDPERLRREAALHTDFEGAGRVASDAGVETLVLVRLRPPPVFDVQVTSVVNDYFGGRIVVAEDGDRIAP